MRHELAERDAAQTYTALFEKPAAGNLLGVHAAVLIVLAVHGLFLGDGFVEIEQHAGNGGPGGGLGGCDAGGQRAG